MKFMNAPLDLTKLVLLQHHINELIVNTLTGSIILVVQTVNKCDVMKQTESVHTNILDTSNNSIQFPLKFHCFEQH